MKHYELEISQFVDNELPEHGRKELFVHLAECEECGRVLADYMEMKSGSRSFYENMEYEPEHPVNLPVLPQRTKERNIYQAMFYFAAAASVVLGLMFFMQQSSTNTITQKYKMLKTEYGKLDFNYNQAIKEVKTAEENYAPQNIPNDIKRGKEKSKKAQAAGRMAYKNTRQNTTDLTAENKDYMGNRPQLIRVVKVTQSDYLTPQIVGN